jgi:hypothetical protein
VINKKKIILARRKMSDLKWKIDEQLPKLVFKSQLRRSRKKEELVIDLWLRNDCRMLAAVLSDPARKDRELEPFSGDVGVAGLFEGIRDDIRKLRTDNPEEAKNAVLAGHSAEDIFIYASQKTMEAGREDIEILLKIIARQLEEQTSQ